MEEWSFNHIFDSWRVPGTMIENGIVDNEMYDVPGYVFYSQSEIVDMMTKCGFMIDYIEKFSRVHTLNRKSITTNEMWKNTNLDIYESWYTICATKI